MSDPQLKSISFEAFTKDLINEQPIKPNYEEELQKIKHEFKQKENVFKKDNALNEQKIELLEIQIKEAKEREENLRKMNDNLASALSELSQDPRKFSNNGLKEIQQTLEKNSKDFLENKMKNNETIKVLEAEIKKLQEINLHEQLKKRDEDLEKDKEKTNLENKIHDLESEKNRLESIIKQIQLDQRKSFDNFTQDNQIKLNKHNEIVDKMKETHERELNQIQEKTQEHFNEMKNIYEQEKSNLEARLEKAQNLLKQYMETSQGMDFDNIQNENQKLLQKFNDMNKSHSEELKLYKKNKEDLQNRLHDLEIEINKLREENRNYKSIKSELERNKLLIKELEASEKSLKVLLNEYQHNFIIQSNETNGSHHTPQLRCEENENDNEYYNENDEVHVEMEDDQTDQENDNVLQEKYSQINKSNKSKKSNSLTSEDLEKIEMKLLADKRNRNSFHNYEKIQKISQKNNFFQEELRKTPVQNKTTSKLPRTNEKLNKNPLPKTSRNNENMPLPISEIGLRSERIAQILENTNYKKAKPKQSNEKKQRISDNTPFALINLTPHYAQNPVVYADENVRSDNIATALLCEICKNSYQPLEFLDHLNSCKSQQSAVRGCCYDNVNNTNMNFTRPIMNHHSSHQNLLIYQQQKPQIQSNFSSIDEHKRTRSFHYQSAQQLAHLNHLNSSSGTNCTSSSSQLNDPKILNVLENLNYEKKLIFDKLREVENRLKHTEDKNNLLNEEKEGLEQHFESIVSQLNQAQMQLMLSEEEKSENELSLKKEIKFLISKLLKAKNKLSEEKIQLKSNHNSSINMSGFLNFYQQNKEDSTFGEKNNDSETSILNQSIQQVISSSALTINNKSKSPIMQKFQSKGQIIQNKINGIALKKNESIRSKTPLMMKFNNENGKIKKYNGNGVNGIDMKGDFIETLEINNRFKKKK